MNHIATLACVQTRSLALGPRFGQVLIAQGRLPWLPSSDFWPSKNQPRSRVERMTKSNKISYFNTDTTHKHRLRIVQHESTWLCYWVSEYLFRYKPWFFVEVDGHRDLQKNNGFSYWFAPGNSHISTKHIWRVFQSLGGTNWHLLISFPCIRCTSSLFNDYIGIFSDFTCGSNADLHEAFR